MTEKVNHCGFKVCAKCGKTKEFWIMVEDYYICQECAEQKEKLIEHGIMLATCAYCETKRDISKFPICLKCGASKTKD